MGNVAIPVQGNYSQWVVPAIDNSSVRMRLVPGRNGSFEQWEELAVISGICSYKRIAEFVAYSQRVLV